MSTQINGRIATITFDQGHNKLSYSLTTAVAEALDQADHNPLVAVIILKGGEKAFSVGAALDELVDLKESEVDAWLNPWEKLSHISKPVIVALDGYVLGGGLEIAMMGDVLIATEETFLGQPEIKLALLPGCGGTLRLMRAIGYHKAAEMCLRGDFIPASKAYEYGLINHVVAKNQLSLKIAKVANAMAKHSIPALIATKSLLRQSFDQSPEALAHLKKERTAFNNLLKTQDGREGLKAFLEKREPVIVDG